jgi:hypothetical protein
MNNVLKLLKIKTKSNNPIAKDILTSSFRKFFDCLKLERAKKTIIIPTKITICENIIILL